MDRQKTDKPKNRQIVKQRERERWQNRHTEKQTDGNIVRLKKRQTVKQTNGKTDRNTDRRINR